MPRPVLRVLPELYVRVQDFASARGCTMTEATDALLPVEPVVLSPASLAAVHAFAADKGLTFEQAADTMIEMARRRVDALAKYGSKKKAA